MNNTDTSLLAQLLEAMTKKRDYWREATHEWIAQNGRGGWIDNLRNSEQARTIERDALDARIAELEAAAGLALVSQFSPDIATAIAALKKAGIQ